MRRKDLEEPCHVAASDGSSFSALSKFPFVPKALDMRPDTAYLLMVVVRAGVGNVSNPSTA